MTTKKQQTKITNKVEWQEVEYDADCSDVEGLSAMPCPVAPGHQNYPIQSAMHDLDSCLERFQQLRLDGSFLPVDVVQINRVMQTFQRELNSVLEAVSSRHTPAATAEDPVAERKLTEKLVVPSAATAVPDQSSLDSGYKSRGRKTLPKTVTFCVRTSSRRTGGTRNRKRTEDDSWRLLDLDYESSPKSQPKPQNSSEVKHKSKHKKEEEKEPTEITELEPTKPNKELRKEFKKIRKLFRKMMNGKVSEESAPNLVDTQKLISDLLEKDPDFPLMEIVEENLIKFI